MSIPQSCKTDAQELTWTNARTLPLSIKTELAAMRTLTSRLNACFYLARKKEIGANGKP